MWDLNITSEQQQIIDAASALMTKTYPVSRLREPEPPEEDYQRLVDFGWFGFGATDRDVSNSYGVVEQVLLYREAGRFLLSPSVLAASIAARISVGEQLNALTDGNMRAAFVVVDGEGAYCLDSDDADIFVRVCADGTRLYDASVLERTRTTCFDDSIDLQRCQFSESAKIMSSTSDHALLLIAAMLVGNVEATSSIAVEHAKTREQFGRPIGAFQAVKHRCADTAIRAHCSFAQLMMAAATSLHDAPEASLQAASAAWIAFDAAEKNAAAAIQTLGAIGFTAELEAHRYLKRALLFGWIIGGLRNLECRLLSDAPFE